ncbi:hypothetical protein [Variovorax paradoxus]|uniref:hypothetical protein n=1 Tax=Variovorax paradoxus TaxID=34073 RepID=UPI003D65A804
MFHRHDVVTQNSLYWCFSSSDSTRNTGSGGLTIIEALKRNIAVLQWGQAPRGRVDSAALSQSRVGTRTVER